MIDEDGFAVEEAGGPGCLEGLGRDFDVGEGVPGGADTASAHETAVVGGTGIGGLEGASCEAQRSRLRI